MKLALKMSFLLLLAAGCSDKLNKKSPPPVPVTKMEKVLEEIHIAEIYSSMLDTTRQGIKNLDSLAVFYKDIFAHHNITQKQFDESLLWYKENPTEVDSSYKRMINQLSALEIMHGSGK